MNITKKLLFTALVASLTLSLYSCKTKKLVAKPAPAPVERPAPVEEKKPAPAPEKEPEKPAPVEKPNFNLDNIQFEFNSFVLKTSSFSILDKAVSEMKNRLKQSLYLMVIHRLKERRNIICNYLLTVQMQ